MSKIYPLIYLTGGPLPILTISLQLNKVISKEVIKKRTKKLINDNNSSHAGMELAEIIEHSCFRKRVAYRCSSLNKFIKLRIVKANGMAYAF